eukprot:6202476-Pleurochrysis_carterae.AAC.3
MPLEFDTTHVWSNLEEYSMNFQKRSTAVCVFLHISHLGNKRLLKCAGPLCLSSSVLGVRVTRHLRPVRPEISNQHIYAYSSSFIFVRWEPAQCLMDLHRPRRASVRSVAPHTAPSARDDATGPQTSRFRLKRRAVVDNGKSATFWLDHARIISTAKLWPVIFVTTT